MKYVLLSLLSVCALMPMAQNTKKFTADKSNEYGLVYTLPKTAIEIEVEAISTIKKSGPYAKFSERYLSLPSAILEDNQSWELKQVRMRTIGEPDKEQEYLMQFKPNQVPYIIVTNESLPLAINAEAEMKAPERIVAVKREATPLDGNKYASSMTEEMLISGSTAKQAEIAAKKITRLRESRDNLASGEADQMPPDGASLKLMMDNLKQQEDNLTALFMGTTAHETTTKIIKYMPTEAVENEVLFRISDVNAITDRNDLSGEPVYISISIDKKGELPIDDKGKEKAMPKGAIAYNIPGTATVTLTYRHNVVAKQSFPIAQFGVVYGLDPDIITDKKAPSYIKFYPETGGVKEIGKVEQ